jgi:hypothetical protein
MMLAFSGDFLSPDSSTLVDHGIADGSVLHVLWHVSPYIHAFILNHNDGGFYPLLMHPYMTVRDVKEAIQHFSGILFNLQQLSICGQNLDNDEELFSHGFSVTGFPLVLHFHASRCTVFSSAGLRE